MRNLAILSFLTFIFSCNNVSPRAGGSNSKTIRPVDSLRASLAAYTNTKKADIGIAVMALEDGDTLSLNGHKHYSLMSVAKFPQALLLLHLVDEGKVAMAGPLVLTSSDLQQRTASTLRKDHPQSPLEIMIPEALKYSIGQSDNITSNKIFATEGGPAAVNAYVHGLGIQEISIVTDYAHMGEDSLHRNWASPWAIAALLKKFYHDRLLSDTNKALLWKVMVEGTSGPTRLKGNLPAGTIVAHKTGTSSTDSTTGTTPAYNDAGIVQLPNGKHFAIVVFVSNSKEPEAENAAIIAHISRACWDYFMAKNK